MAAQLAQCQGCSGYFLNPSEYRARVVLMPDLYAYVVGWSGSDARTTGGLV